MPDENKNPDVGQVPSQNAATDITLEKIAKMKPDELLNLYTNSQEAIKAATQRNMETAEERKRVQAEREYWESEAKRQSEERQRAYDLLSQTVQQGRPMQPTTPDFTNIAPETALTELYKQQQETRRLLEEERRAAVEREQKLMSEINATRSAVSYQEFLKTEVYPKYADVAEKDIDDWFSKNPMVRAEPATVIAAAQEIQRKMDERVEAKVQARLQEKERLAQQAQGLGGGTNAPMAALPEGKSMFDLPEEKQREILYDDFKKSGILDK